MNSETQAIHGRHEGHHDHGDHHDKTEIIVNGRGRAVEDDEIEYEEIVQLAFPGPQTDPNVIFSVTYRHAAAEPFAGELGPGGSIHVRNGTIFNVTRTVKS